MFKDRGYSCRCGKLTVEKLKGKLKDIGAWNENCQRKLEKYLQEKLRDALNNRANSETNPAQEKPRGGTTPLNINFDREIKPASGVMF